MKRALALAAAGMMAVTVPAVTFPSIASAQSYDPCRDQQRQSANKGTIVGGLVGALAGGGVAAKGAKTEGALLGGALGALGGAAVGKNSAACGGTTYRAPQTTYNGYYGQPADNGYYARSYDERRNYDRGEPYRVVERPAATDGCTLAESPIYLPDGRTQKRFVRVCPDANGNFQVVD